MFDGRYARVADPTALAFALIAALGGAALATVAASIGAIWQSKREHKKWLRERRFDAYKDKELVPAMRSLDLYFAAIAAVKRDLDILNEARAAVPDASYTAHVDRLQTRLDATMADESRSPSALSTRWRW